MKKTFIYNLAFNLLCGLILSCAANNRLYAADKKVWITLGDAAYTELQHLTPNTLLKDSRIIETGSLGFASQEKIHLVQMNQTDIHALSGAIHIKLKRCGGYMEHASEAQGRAALDVAANGFTAAPSVMGLAPSYTIDNQTTVTPLLAQMQAPNIGQTIVDLSNIVNRYYTTAGGVSGSNWIKNKWQQLANGRSYVTVEQFTHAGWPQKSVIMTVQGSDNAGEVIVLGAHIDSINHAGTSETTRAPGADDDASGIASLTETVRVLMESNYRPRRTIKFMAYAAEEVGLKGSAEIAKKYKTDGIKVVGVMQLDMTNYKGSTQDIYIYTDYADSAQNTFLANLITTYQPGVTIGYNACGYACSDHASWYGQGFTTSYPDETVDGEDNPNMHTAGDTYAFMGSQANKSLKFARLATSYAVELGSDGPALPPPTTALSNGVPISIPSLPLNTTKTFSLLVPSGKTTLNIKLSGGSGDGDLFAKFGSTPSTTVYDAKSDGSTNAETITIKAPKAGTYFVLVKAYAAVSNASIVATFQ
ncbi:MAG: M20/M25/M40 family metallo-hydrolase [Undibacterium sp.]|nr:M20/M25/M40 family metallo-hydrolase [Undibacterium sp.]